MADQIQALSAADIAEINDLCVRYSFAWDEGEAELVGSFFTADGVFDTQTGSPTVGPAAIAELVRNTPPGVHHFLGGVTAEATSFGAAGKVHLQAFLIDATAVRLLAVARYDDELVKTEDGWRFRSRRITGFTGPSLAGLAVIEAPSA